MFPSHDMLRLIAVIDGVWFAFSACVVVVFSRYLILEISARSKARRFAPAGVVIHQARIEAALALLAYFMGETMWRGLSWWSRTHADFNPAWASVVFVAAGSLAVIGAMVCVRLFTPAQCGTRSWVAAFGVALVLSAVSIYIT